MKNYARAKAGSKPKIDLEASEFIEQLAELEHEQWMQYSKSISKKIENAKSLHQLREHIDTKWSPNWKKYAVLSESDKDKDREWAYKVIDLLKGNKSALRRLLSE